jgi:hypothetical protein
MKFNTKIIKNKPVPALSDSYYQAILNPSDDILNKEELILFEDIYNRFYFNYNSFSLNTSIYNLIQSQKMDYCYNLFQGKRTIKLPKVNLEDYSSIMLQALINYMKRNIDKQKDFTTQSYNVKMKFNDVKIQTLIELEHYLENLCQDIKRNQYRLPETLIVEYTNSEKQFENGEEKIIHKIQHITFSQGLIITKFWSRFTTKVAKFLSNNKIIGNFKPQPTKQQPIYLTISALMFPLAGIIGHSCLSPGGENVSASALYLGEPHILIAFNQDFSNRAFVLIQDKLKLYNIFQSYPVEDYILQITVRKFFENKGYKESNRLKACTYMDYSLTEGFYHKELEFDKDNQKLPSIKVFEVKYPQTLFNNAPHQFSGHLFYQYKCEGCGKTFLYDVIDDRGFCDECSESYADCDGCGTNVYVDDLHYFNSLHLCNACFEDAKEEMNRKNCCECKTDEDQEDMIPYKEDNYICPSCYKKTLNKKIDTKLKNTDLVKCLEFLKKQQKEKTETEITSSNLIEDLIELLSIYQKYCSI